MSRLLISSWDIPGICDIRTMTHVVNAHMRRHDTFRSWFEHTEGDHFVRRTLERPNDIQFVAVEHGELTTQSQWRERLLATPSPLEWGCVRFSIIQRADHFTFCVAIDHLHCDAMFVGVVFAEIHLMYLPSSAAELRCGWPNRQLRQLLQPAAGAHLRSHPGFPGHEQVDRILRQQRRLLSKFHCRLAIPPRSAK
ncbi:condensation domain protein [Mycobacterium ulcerans str. Harvey]|uniref:Condensation domain protein n=1 Tax=Mycobacterium ulcerans str. Harvey TaxID=1299332 RepID=A0ABN0RA11_MYCUL|nr:condensation domain protein [Mycobacterium ulcerans str. Harvey]